MEHKWTPGSGVRSKFGVLDVAPEESYRKARGLKLGAEWWPHERNK